MLTLSYWMVDCFYNSEVAINFIYCNCKVKWLELSLDALIVVGILCKKIACTIAYQCTLTALEKNAQCTQNDRNAPIVHINSSSTPFSWECAFKKQILNCDKVLMVSSFLRDQNVLSTFSCSFLSTLLMVCCSHNEPIIRIMPCLVPRWRACSLSTSWFILWRTWTSASTSSTSSHYWGWTSIWRWVMGCLAKCTQKYSNKC